jgi:hypothetical protein
MSQVDLIENYLDGKLTEKELSDFEIRLKTDQEFAREVETHREVNSFIKKKAKMEEFKSTLTEAADDYFNEQNPLQKKTLRISWVYKTAAAVLILIATSMGLYLLLKPVSPEKIYAQYYQPYPTDVFTRSDNTNKSDFILALQQFQQKNYKKALEIFSIMPESDSLKVTISFYCGLSYLETGNNESAIICLQKATTDETNAIYTVAQWYLSLAYLKNNETDKAIPILEKIKASGAYNAEKASKVLEELK